MDNQLFTLLQKMARQPAKTEVFNVRLSEAHREALDMLADVYDRPRGQVIADLIQQAATDHHLDGEVLALVTE